MGSNDNMRNYFFQSLLYLMYKLKIIKYITFTTMNYIFWLNIQMTHLRNFVINEKKSIHTQKKN